VSDGFVLSKGGYQPANAPDEHEDLVVVLEAAKMVLFAMARDKSSSDPVPVREKSVGLASWAWNQKISE